MKFIASLLFASVAFAQNVATAQSPTPAKAHPATHAAATTHTTTAASHGCAKVPELSPKIPAAPAGAGCAKPLYSITTVPNVLLTDISPLETPELREMLGIPTASSFSLAYIDVKAGTGALAAPHKWYSIQYTGYLPDGFKFDSSYDKPDHEPLNFLQGPGPGPQGRRMVVPGMDTGIDGMHVGGKRRLYIPFQLGYGPNGNPQAKIPAKSWLIFDIELVAQGDTEPAPKTPPPPPASAAPAQPTSLPAPPASAAPSAPIAPQAAPTAPTPATPAPPAPTAAPPTTAPAVVAPKPQ
jgi:peptidylprolyl isomerase